MIGHIKRRGEFTAGFTLMEILVYAAILVLVVVTIIAIAVSLARFYKEAKEERSLRASAEAAFERMEREVRFAGEVLIGSSVLNTHPGTLALTTIDPFTESAQTVTFQLDGTQLGMQVNANPIAHLTSDDVAITNLVFRHITAGTVSEAIRVELTIGGENFYATTILRRSY